MTKVETKDEAMCPNPRLRMETKALKRKNFCMSDQILF